jgi:hypothetical protein
VRADSDLVAAERITEHGDQGAVGQLNNLAQIRRADPGYGPSGAGAGDRA